MKSFVETEKINSGCMMLVILSKVRALTIHIMLNVSVQRYPLSVKRYLLSVIC